jgi:tRNA/rRNA methyltransferase
MTETALSALSNVRIVLVEPAGPLNVGSIARIMKNMGLQQLVLVNPHCDPLGAEARQMAVRGIDILEAAQQVATLPAALQDCHRAIATLGRDWALETALEPPISGLPWLVEAGDSQAPSLMSALIFGPEDRGLSNAELNYAQRFIRIPSSSVYPSLNLAQAVAVCCYELRLAVTGQRASLPCLPSAQTELPSQDSGFDRADPAPFEVLEGYYQQLEALLLEIGYLYPHTAASRMEKFRRLFNRSQPSTAEVSMLRGILSQMQWYLQTHRN